MSSTPQTQDQPFAEAVLEPDLPICDAHIHVMDAHGFRYLLDDHLRDAGGGHRIVSSVYVEASAWYRTSGPEHLRAVGEIEFARGLEQETRSAHTHVARGVVGHVDLRRGALAAEALDAQIEAGGGLLKGIRHGACWDATGTFHNRHPDIGPDLYGQPDFRAGFAELAKRGLSLDAWQYFHQLPVLAGLARDFPDGRLLINHTGGVVGAGPYAGRRDEVFQAWRGHMRDLAQYPNVWVKLGGLGMTMTGFGFHERGAPPSSEELAAAWRPYIETCIEAFGPQRCMFESNFPVDRHSCSYGALWNAFKRIAAGASADEKALLFHDSAGRFYRLDALGGA